MNRCFISLLICRYQITKFPSLFFIPLAAGFILQLVPMEVSEIQIQGCLFLMDRKDLMCVPCRESVFQFSRYIQAVLLKNQITGILIYDEKLDEKDEHHFFIMQKKLLGWMKKNHIGFEVFIDRNHVFNVLAGNGTTIILFFSKKPFIKKYDLPLDEAQWMEIKKMK